MRFAEGSIVAPYMEEEIEYQKGKFGKQWYSIPYELEPATLMESNYYRFLIGDPGDGAAGCFCGDGRARWTLRLLAEKVVELEIVESISKDGVRAVLKKRRCSLT